MKNNTDLFNDIQSDLKLLSIKINELKQWGSKKAEAEEQYRIALSKFLAEQILKGNKVTILGDLARGQKEIALLRKNRDKYNILYETTQESIYAIKTQIRINETMLKLEYGAKE
jgi:hypothetical protein